MITVINRDTCKPAYIDEKCIVNIDEHSDALIPLDSQMRESTHDKEYQEQLHIVNETLRKLKSMNEKKRTDIEKELSKYFIS